MFTQPVFLKKFHLNMLALMLLCVPFTNGLFIYTDSCGKGSSTDKHLKIDPLEGTWFRVMPRPEAHVELTSKLDKPCYIGPNVIFQLLKVNNTVKILNGETIFCTIPTSHQWLSSKPKIITVVSCNRDESAAKNEIQSINSDGDSELNPSREGKNLVTATSVQPELTSELTEYVTYLGRLPSVSSIRTSTYLPEDTTLLVDNSQSSIGLITEKTDMQTVSLLPINTSIHTPTKHIIQETSSPNAKHKTSSPMPELTHVKVSSTMGTTSSTKYHISSEKFVTDTSGIMVTGAISTGGLTNKIVYIVIICFGVLFIFVITYGCFLLYRWRQRQNNIEINQRLVNKKNNVVNYRNAEEGEVQMKYMTMGRKKSKENIIEDAEVPKCLR